jgi:hypothetical protein
VKHLYENHNDKESRWTATQGMLYSGAFLITWTPSTISSIVFWSGHWGYEYEMLTSIVEPLQGFWNLLIILRSNPSSVDRLTSFLKCGCCKSFATNDIQEELPESSLIDMQNKEQKQEQKSLE